MKTKGKDWWHGVVEKSLKVYALNKVNKTCLSGNIQYQCIKVSMSQDKRSTKQQS